MNKSNKTFWCILIIALLIIIGYISIQLYASWLREQTKEESIPVVEEFFLAIQTHDITRLDEIMSEDALLRQLNRATYEEGRQEIMQKWENADFTAEGGEIMSTSSFHETYAVIILDNITLKGKFGESDYIHFNMTIERIDSDDYKIVEIAVFGDSNVVKQVWYTGN